MGRLSRFSPLTGVIFAVLLVLSFLASPNSPGTDASGAQVIAFYKAHASSQKGWDTTFVLAVVFFLFFAGSLRKWLRRAPAAESQSAVMLVGAAMLTTGFTIFAGLDYTIADVPNSLDPAAAQALNAANNDVFFTVVAGGLVFGVASGLAILRGSQLPKWLGWVAIVIGLAIPTPADFPALMALAVWTVIVSVLMILRGGAAAPAPVADAHSAAGAVSG